jgi:subtilisin-like proprotein convertase family protein
MGFVALKRSAMAFSKWGRWFRSARRSSLPYRKHPKRRPAIELLEDRVTPATIPQAQLPAPIVNGQGSTAVPDTLGAPLPAPVTLTGTNVQVVQDPIDPTILVEVHQNPAGTQLQGSYSLDGGASWHGMINTDPAFSDQFLNIADPNISNIPLVAPPAPPPGNNQTLVTSPYTNVSVPSIAMDRAHQMYLVFTEHNAANSSGALILDKFDFSAAQANGAPSLSIANEIIEQWAGADPVFNPVVAVDDNAPLFVDPTATTNNTQADTLAGNDTLNTTAPKAVYVAWNTNNTAPTGIFTVPNFNPNVIKVTASSDGAAHFTTPQFVNAGQNVSGLIPAAAHYSDPKIVFAQGSGDGRVTGGQLIFVFNDYGNSQLVVDASTPDGGSATTRAAAVESFNGGVGPVTDAVAGTQLVMTTVNNVGTGGTGYAVGDVIALAGGTPVAPLGPAQIRVTSINPSSPGSTTGAITGAVLFSSGNYSALPPPIGGTTVPTTETVTLAPAGISSGGSVNVTFNMGTGDIPQTTTFTNVVTITDPNFTLKDLDVPISLSHPNLNEISIDLIAPASTGLSLAQRTIHLLRNQTNNFGQSTGANVGIIAGVNMGILNGFDLSNAATALGPTVGAANLGSSGAGVESNIDIGIATVFDSQAARPINDPGATAPYIGHFRPESSSLNVFNGLTATQLSGTWTLSITDNKNSGTSAPFPYQRVQAWGLRFSGYINSTGFGVDGLLNPLSGWVPVPLKDNFTAPYATGTAGAPGPQGIGAGFSVAIDNTLGAFGPYEGRLYIAYNSSGGANVFLGSIDNITPPLTSAIVNSPLQVNDDSAATNFSGAGKWHYNPTVAVDQSTGTVGVMYYDANFDASNVRVATSFIDSIDGGQTFSPSNYLNVPNAVTDMITGKVINWEPIPGNEPQAGALGFGGAQGLIMWGGNVLPMFASNFNSANVLVMSATVTIAGGPRIIKSDQGPVTGDFITPGSTALYNDKFAADGTRMLTGMFVQFDRPIDVGAQTVGGTITGATESPSAIIVSTATETGNYVTVTTASNHGYTAGQTVTITGSSITGYNGTFTILSTTANTFTYSDTNSGLAPSTGGSASVNFVTITTTTPHGLVVGQQVSISGVTVAGYNGTFLVTGILTPTLFTYSLATSGLAASAAGTVRISTFDNSQVTVMYHDTGTSTTIAPSPGGATEIGNVVTITTTTPHGLQLGQQISISGIGITGYNGNWTVTGILSPTSFTYTASTRNMAPSGGGGVTLPGTILPRTDYVVVPQDGTTLTATPFGVMGAGTLNSLATQMVIEFLVPQSKVGTYSYAVGNLSAGVQFATVQFGGTGYTVGDVLTVNGGLLTVGGTPTSLLVSSVGANGAITGASVVNAGSYVTLPTNFLSVIGGTGQGALFSGTFTGAAGTLRDAIRTQIEIASADVPTITIAGGTTGFSETGTIATVFTNSFHGLVPGEQIVISGAGVAGYNGTFTVRSVDFLNTFTYDTGVAGLGLSGGGTVTVPGVTRVTTSTPHNLQVGQSVAIREGTNTTYDGIFKIVSVVDSGSGSTQFDYIPITPGAFIGGDVVALGNYVDQDQSARSIAALGSGLNPTTGQAPASANLIPIVVSPFGASETGTSVTITTTVPSGLIVGQTVTIQGVNEANYNGTFTITSISASGLTFTYTDPVTSLPNSGGGFVVVSIGSPNDVYAAPNPTSGPPFQLPYSGDSLPMIIPGPHVVATSVPNVPSTNDNRVVNNTNNTIDVTFDRDIVASSFTGANVANIVGPAGTISSYSLYTTGFSPATTVNTAGTGYKIGDIISAVGGVTTGAAQFTVTAVNASGGIQTVSLLSKGSYSTLPATPVAVSGGSGSAALLNGVFTGPDIVANGSTFTSNLKIADSLAVNDLAVGVNISNANVAGLIISLVSPTGIQVPLYAGGATGSALTNTIFDGFQNTPISSGTAPYTAVFHPALSGNTLAILNGQNFSGTWQLKIQNNSGTTAQLNSWTLNPVLVQPVSATGAKARTFQVIFPTQSLSGTYNFTFGPDPTGRYPTDTNGNQVDTNFNAGVDLLRGGDPVNGTIQKNTYNSGAVNIPIQAGQTATSSIFVPTSYLVQGATLTLTIQHPNDPDLSATLMAPDGTTVVLFTGVGTTGASPHANFTNTTFDDSASIAIQNATTIAGVGIGAGPYTPQFPLTSAFKDHGSQGLWTLSIHSKSSVLNGSLVSWTLNLKSSTFGSGLGETVADRFAASFRIFTQDPTNPVSQQSWTAVGPASVDTGASTGIASVTIYDFGKGYKVNDVLIVQGGNTLAPGTEAQLQVTSINAATGAITGIKVISTGSYTSLPLATINSPLTVSASGTGTGARFLATYTTAARSGTVNAIAVDPSDPSGNTVYVAGAAGGVWKTTNFLTADPNGPSYVPLTDLSVSNGIDIGSLAVFGRNKDPNQSVIFALTGNGNIDPPNVPAVPTTVSPGVGILRSMDGGKTWQLLDSTVNVDATGNILPLNDPARNKKFLGTSGFKIIVDPTPQANGNLWVYMALGNTPGSSGGGIWRSKDSGNTWTLLQAGNATDVALAQGSADATGFLQVLYGAITSTANAGIYFTASATLATSMSPRNGGGGVALRRDIDFLPDIPVGLNTAGIGPGGANGRITIAVPAKTGLQPQDTLYEGWIYAAVATAAGSFKGLYMSKDFGANWTLVHLGVTPLGAPTNNNLAPSYDPTIVPVQANFSIPQVPTQGNYDLSLAVDPNNPNVVYLGATSANILRIDVTKMSDVYSMVAHNNHLNDGGQLFVNTSGPVTTKAANNNYGMVEYFPPLDPLSPIPVLIGPYYNLERDPDNPFLTPSSLQFSGIGLFTNTGFDALWSYFDGGAGAGLDTVATVAMRDPITGKTRLIFGTDGGVFIGEDHGDGTVEAGIGSAVPVLGTRNGNLQIAAFNDGTSQPNVLAAGNAGALFYGMSGSFGFPVGIGYPISDAGILDTGNLNWNRPLPPSPPNLAGTPAVDGFGFGVLTDPQGSGNVYMYKSPADSLWGLAGATDFFSIQKAGQAEISATGTTGNSLLQLPGDNPALAGQGQWPQIPGTKFAVNPADPSGIVMGSQTPLTGGAGDGVFLSNGPVNGYGKNWFQIAAPADIGGTNPNSAGAQPTALAFGAPSDTTNPLVLDNFIYVGTASGGVFVTFTGGGVGTPWKNITANLPAGAGAVQQIVPDPTPGSTDLYIATTNGVFFMADSSAAAPTWVNLTGNLFSNSLMRTVYNDPSRSVNTLNSLTSLQVDWRYAIPVSGGSTTPVLYAAGDGGVFRSLDQGTTWTYFPDTAVDGARQEGGFLPSAQISTLTLVVGNINPTDGTAAQQYGLNMLLATTEGRGTFAIRIDDQILVPSTGKKLSTYAISPVAGPHVTSLTTSPGTTLTEYANSVTAVTTEFTPPPGPDSSIQALGAPNAFIYTDPNGLGWVPWVNPATGTFNIQDSITLAYVTPLHATGVAITEAWGNGFVAQIEVHDASQPAASGWHVVWPLTPAVDPTLPGAVTVFNPTFPQTNYAVDEVRITVNTTATINNQNALPDIDAVQLQGTDPSAIGGLRATFSGPVDPVTFTTADISSVTGPASTLVSVTPAGGGSGYNLGDILNVVGANLVQAQIQVTGVSAGGAVTSAVVLTPGLYTTIPANPLSVTDLTTPAATGAKFTGVWSNSVAVGTVADALGANPHNLYDIFFQNPTTVPGFYNVTFGPKISDFSGYQMDQNQNVGKPNGANGEPGVSPTGDVFSGRVLFQPWVNQAPVLDPASTPAPFLPGVGPNTPASAIPGTAIASFITSLPPTGITDPDNTATPGWNQFGLVAPEGIAVTGIDNTNGDWQYSLDGGTTWIDFSSSRGSFVSFPTSARLLQGSDEHGNPTPDRIRFVPNAGVGTSGPVTTSFQYRAWDLTSGLDPVTGADGGTGDSTINGGSTAYSSQLGVATMTISTINQAPLFNFPGIPTVNLLEDAGPQSVPGFVTNISPGDNFTPGQNLKFKIISNSNPSLFSAGPAINGNNTFAFSSVPSHTLPLTFTAAPNANGTATVTFVLQDDGGTVNGGQDTSAPQTVTINVTPVNDAPSFVPGGNVSVLEDTGPATFPAWTNPASFLAGPPDEVATQTFLGFNITSNSNPSLFAAGGLPAINVTTGDLTFTPAANAFGTATITVRLHDSGGTANGGVDLSAPQTFTITITGVNDAPSFTKGADQSIREDAGAQSIAGWATGISAGPNESSQTVNFVITNINYTGSFNSNSLFFTTLPTISAAGVLSYQTAPNANGTATVSIAIHDNGGTANGGVDTSASQTFNINVSAVNDAPSYTLPTTAVTVTASASPQTVTGFATNILPYAAAPTPPALDEVGQTVTFSITGNSNPSMFAAGGAPAVSSTGTLTFTPASITTRGTATITLVAKDNGGTANGGVDTAVAKTFTITINTATSLTETSPPAGGLTASYGGTMTLTANITPTTVGSLAGQIVTFTAKNLATSAVTTLGTATIQTTGVATTTVAVPLPGNYTVTASYAGNTTNFYNASQSTANPLTVPKLNPAVALAAAPSPAGYGLPVVFTATFTPGTVSALSLAGQIVTFVDTSNGNAVLGTAPIVVSGTTATATLNFANSGATALTLGTHVIKATNAGDSNWNSNSNTTSLNVLVGSTTAVVGSPNPSGGGVPVTLTATITLSKPTGNGTVLTTSSGTVTFKDTTTNVVLASNVPLSQILSGGNQAKAVFTTSATALANGVHNIVATYTGVASSIAGSSGSTTQSVLKSTSISLVTANSNVALNTAATFTATVTGTGGVPTGNVTFYIYNSSNVLVATGTGGLTSGKATFKISTLPVGTYTVKAQYTGDTVFGPSPLSAPITQVVSNSGRVV